MSCLRIVQLLLNCCSSDVSLEADEENHAVVTCESGSDVSGEGTNEEKPHFIDVVDMAHDDEKVVDMSPIREGCTEIESVYDMNWVEVCQGGDSWWADTDGRVETCEGESLLVDCDTCEGDSLLVDCKKDASCQGCWGSIPAEECFSTPVAGEVNGTSGGGVFQKGHVDCPSSSLMGGDCMNEDLMPCSMLLNSVGLPASDLWLLDSGASVSVVSKDFLKGFQHSPIQTLVNPLQAANGTSVNVDGFCKVLLEVQVVDGKRENKPPKPAVLPVDVVVGKRPCSCPTEWGPRHCLLVVHSGKPPATSTYLPVARGGIGASQYFHSFSTSGKQEPLSTITLDAHPLPIDFTEQLFQYENWPSADNLLIEATQTTPDTKDFYLSLWCPEEAAHLSPDHSITVCNQHAGNSFPVHGASFAPTDHHTQIEGRSVWECSHTHNPGGEHLASLLPQLCTYWPAFLEGVGVQLSNFKEFIEQAHRTATFATRPGVAAWRFPPHSLATNTFRLLFSLFATPGILIEGFGAGTSFSAAAGLIALARGQFASVLLCLGGVAMHPPTFCKLLPSYTFFYERDFKLHQDFLEEKRPDKKTRPPNYRPQHSAVEPQHGFLIVQHLHDRRAPWTLTPLILSHLYNKGISVLTLHNDLAAQRAHAEKFGKDFRPRSHWGRYRHNYEDLVPTLKTFCASTFFSNFCGPLTWEQLEAREGTLGVSYSPDLLDLFFAFLSYHSTLPLPFFRATPDVLEKVLLQGCYRPQGALAGLFHISQEPHETPANFYTRAFLLPLRFPCLTTLGLPPPDIFAIESAVRQELLRVPLPQALDFLHSQILAILCVNAPRRPKGSQKIHSIDPCPPTACYLVFPERATAGVPDPPQFRCWISRRVAPNMAVIGLKCNSTPWACSHVDGTSGNLFVGFTPGNFLQLAFPTDDERFPPQKGSNASHFAFALYITSTSGNKGRVGKELPTEQKDTGPTYVTAINGILLPFLLRHKLRPAPSSSAATSTLFQIGLPLFPREDSLAEALELPPLSMEHSFYMPVWAIRGYN